MIAGLLCPLFGHRWRTETTKLGCWRMTYAVCPRCRRFGLVVDPVWCGPSNRSAQTRGDADAVAACRTRAA